jgi:putative ABC transport system ATP-binding protein
MTTPIIELERVSKVFSSAAPVAALRDADLSVQPGEHLSIMGPSGSGKSTLLNILGLLDRPTKGTYQLDGFDTADLNDREISALRGRRIGFVFQAFHLLPHRTATENVMLAQLYNRSPRGKRKKKALAALSRVGLSHRADAYPTTLSGGEQQRVAVARALVNSPSLLLLDEPTGNLDSVSAAMVLDVIDTLHADGFTVVVITHDPEVAARAQRQLHIRDGELEEVEVR